MRDFRVEISRYWTTDNGRHRATIVSLGIEAASDEYAQLFADGICASMSAVRAFQNPDNDINETFDASISEEEHE